MSVNSPLVLNLVSAINSLTRRVPPSYVPPDKRAGETQIDPKHLSDVIPQQLVHLEALVPVALVLETWIHKHKIIYLHSL